MTLPTSGALTLNDIQTEFGGSNPISLDEYYAGGAYVAAGTSGTYGAVPSSGAISIQNFYGTSAVVVNFTNASISAYSFSFAQAGYQIASTGYAREGVNGTYTNIEQWVTPASAATNYEVFVSYTGDPPTSGTVGSWVACSSAPVWAVSAYNNTLTCTLSFQVRKIGTTTVLDTWTVVLFAESTPP